MPNWVPCFIILGLLAASLDAAEADAEARIKEAQPSIDLLKSGMEKHQKRDYVGALVDLEGAMRFSPNDAAFHLTKAFVHQTEGNFSEAIADYREANIRYPLLALIYFNAGLTRYRIGDHYAAILDYTTALNLKANYGDAFGARGEARLALDDFDGALADLSQAIAFSSHKSYAYARRGVTYYTLGKIEAAIEDFTNSIALEPKMIRSYRARGFAYSLLGDTKLALEDMSRILELYPHAVGFRDRGWIHLLMERDDLALADFKQADKLAPHILSTIRAKAIAYDILGDSDTAIPAYEEAIKLADALRKRSDRIYLSLYLNLLRVRTTGSQLSLGAYFDDLLQWPDDWAKRVLLYLSGRITAESLIQSARQAPLLPDRQKQECEALYYIGISHAIAGKHETARDYFERCIATKRNDMIEYLLAKRQLSLLIKSSPVAKN